uniref:Uncharacterized protein n=1 Tax=mine drainage metagenome TaxID=410659 RepID=E6QQH1_9ZZZZ
MKQHSRHARFPLTLALSSQESAGQTQSRHASFMLEDGCFWPPNAVNGMNFFQYLSRSLLRMIENEKWFCPNTW